MTQYCDEIPYINGKFKKAKWQHKGATKMFDYTAVADRLRVVSGELE